MKVVLSVEGVSNPRFIYAQQGSTTGTWRGTVQIRAALDGGRSNLDFSLPFEGQQSLDDGVTAAMRGLAKLCRSLAEEADRYATYRAFCKINVAAPLTICRQFYPSN